MTKVEFLDALRKGLRRFPKGDVDSAVNFYDELIFEKISKNNLSETEAVATLGDVKNIVSSCSADLILEDKHKNTQTGVLITLGVLFSSPVLLPIAIVVLALYIVVFSVWIACVIASGASAIALTFSSVASFLGGFGVGPAFLISGISLVGLVVCVALCYFFVVYGLKFINLITVQLAKKVMNKRDK